MALGFPRLYAAASLKHRPRAVSRATPGRGFPRLYAAASLKRWCGVNGRTQSRPGFPRLYAAASLKRHGRAGRDRGNKRFSAALCRGLIEAAGYPRPGTPDLNGFPRLYAAASLKQAGRCC